jgi:hypothetical protein
MAKLRFEIEGSHAAVAFPTYVSATTYLLKLLRELDTIILSRYRGTLQWYVSHLASNGSLALEMVSRVRQLRSFDAPHDVGPRVATSLVKGFDNIANLGVSPPYFSEYGLRNMGEMIDVLNRNGAYGYKATAMDANQTVAITPKAAEVVRQLLPIKRSYIGSAEGTLEAITIRGGKFLVYDALTDRAIACRSTDSDLERVKELLGHRVVVSDVVHTNIRSEPVRVDVENMRVLGAGRLPSTKELTGAYPNITNGMTTEECLRSIRGD